MQDECERIAVVVVFEEMLDLLAMLCQLSLLSQRGDQTREKGARETV
jgi:hypothetical protein